MTVKSEEHRKGNTGTEEYKITGTLGTWTQTRKKDLKTLGANGQRNRIGNDLINLGNMGNRTLEQRKEGIFETGEKTALRPENIGNRETKEQNGR